jgi:DNA-binding NarL/FixJ family response regulator
MTHAPCWPPYGASTSLVILSAYELVRVGLRTMLASVPGLLISEETVDEGLVLALCRKTRPHIVLLDVQMPGRDGLAMLRLLKDHWPETKVIILTADERSDYLLAMGKAGAVDYLFKDVTQQALIAAIQNALPNPTELHRETPTNQPTKEGIQPAHPLTTRELAVVQLVAQGLTNREIAEQLAVRPGTIKVHVERIIAKLGVANRTQAAIHAAELLSV